MAASPQMQGVFIDDDILALVGDTRDLLEFLDDCSDSTLDTPCVEDTIPNGTQCFPTKKHVTCSASRRRRPGGTSRARAEVLRLRLQLRDLEEELACVRMRQSTAIIPTHVSRHPTQAETIWKSVAKRQFRARREAERTNEQLKKSIEDQRKLASEFIRLLRHQAFDNAELWRSRREDDKKAPRHKGIYRITEHDTNLKASECEKLLLLAEDLLVEAKSQYKNPTLKLLGDDERLGRSFDITLAESHHVKVDSDTANKAIWEYYTSSKDQFQNSNVRFMMRGFEMRVCGDLGRSQGTIVGRRHIEHGGSVIVWVADVAPSIDIPFVQHIHLPSFQASGWAIVTESEEATSRVEMKHRIQVTKSLRNVLPRVLHPLFEEALRQHYQEVLRAIETKI